MCDGDRWCRQMRLPRGKTDFSSFYRPAELKARHNISFSLSWLCREWRPEPWLYDRPRCRFFATMPFYCLPLWRINVYTNIMEVCIVASITQTSMISIKNEWIGSWAPISQRAPGLCVTWHAWCITCHVTRSANRIASYLLRVTYYDGTIMSLRHRQPC